MDKNDEKLTLKILENQKKILSIIPFNLIFFYDELKTTILHRVAKFGNSEIFKIYVDLLKYLVKNKEDQNMLFVKDNFTGCDFLNYCCKECNFDIISQILPLYNDKENIVSKAKNGNTCLHNLVFNRILTIVFFLI